MKSRGSVSFHALRQKLFVVVVVVAKKKKKIHAVVLSP